MKQHITEDQLGELTDKGREKLVDYFKSNDLLPHFDKPTLMMFSYDEQVCYAMTIGGMIELLDQSVPFWSIYTWYHDNSKCDKCGNRTRDLSGRKLFIVIGNHIEFLEPSELWAGKEELCDALWQACVEILNKES